MRELRSDNVLVVVLFPSVYNLINKQQYNISKVTMINMMELTLTEYDETRSSESP